jgi:hypothetical protein
MHTLTDGYFGCVFDTGFRSRRASAAVIHSSLFFTTSTGAPPFIVFRCVVQIAGLEGSTKSLEPDRKSGPRIPDGPALISVLTFSGG